jgi:carbon-monoxide dehydrogenase large subunit
VLAHDRVRYAGEPVAVVVAETPEQAADAAELVTVDAEELPSLLEPRAATDAPPLHEQAPDNVLLHWRRSAGEVDTAFARAHTVVRARIAMPRLIAAPLEPRAVLADYDAQSDLLTLWLSAQDQHRQLSTLTAVLRRPRNACESSSRTSAARSAARASPRPRRWRSRSRPYFSTDP